MNYLAADVSTANNDLATDDGLRTAVMLSLFTDRRAESGDVLPDAEDDRRGWWADAFPVAPGDEIGSRLWLLAREKESPSVIARAEEYAKEALQWMLDDGVASRVDVEASIPSRGLLVLAVSVYRPRVDPVQYRFTRTWAAEGA